MHLKGKSEQEVNTFLGVVVDMEHIYTVMSREQNSDPKKVYNYFFKVVESHLVCRSLN